jgi:two-component system, OmpR family, sensor histidine kinase MtrB
MSLRRSLTAIVGVLTAFAFGTALVLIGLTSYLHRTASEVADALNSIRLIQQLEIDLLVHARSLDPFVRTGIQADTERELQNAERYIDTDTERRALHRAEKDAAAYFRRAAEIEPREAEQLPDLTAAIDSLRELLDINTAEAKRAETQAARWNDVIGRAVPFIAGALVLAVTIVLVWLWRYAFQPVLNIRDAMTDFAGGKRFARAAEQGPDELRSIAAQFNQLADTLKRQYENQLVFLTGVAHDLRNPLSPLKMSTAVLDSKGGLPPEHQIRSVAAMIARQVDRLDRMIGDLLDASRIEAGNLELRAGSHDARQLARNAFDLFESASSTHWFELKVPDYPVPIHCDAFRMEQVLNNLLSNAIKYSPAGGRVQIAAAMNSGEAVIRVTDEGVGIRSEDIPFIFEPFRRIRSANTEIPGIGLGLSIARRIVEAHKGRIEVKSEPGKGTSFAVHLPAASPT